MMSASQNVLFCSQIEKLRRAGHRAYMIEIGIAYKILISMN